MKTEDTDFAFESIARAAKAATPTERPAPVFTMGGTVSRDYEPAAEVRTVKVHFGSIFWPIMAAWAACGVLTAIIFEIVRS